MTKRIIALGAFKRALLLGALGAALALVDPVLLRGAERLDRDTDFRRDCGQ